MMIRDENDNQIFEDKEVYAYTKDHLGSIREIVDYNGEVKQRYTYSSYGETKIAKTNPKDEFIDSPYAYTSRELDLESGDMFYRARYYSPSEGRFVSEDPIGFAGSGSNYYRYVLNSPVNLTDPTGNNPFAVAGGVAGGVIGGITGGTQSSASCFLGVAADAVAGAATGFAGGFLLGFGLPGSGLLATGATSIGGAVAGLGPAAISVFGDFGSGFCSPPPPPDPSCGDK